MNDEGVKWLRRVVEGDLARAKGLLSRDWGDRPWAVTECGDDEAGNCPCIVYQGEYKPVDEPQVPLIRYIADAETPELAAWIARHNLRAGVARCEAELAILDEHASDTTGKFGEQGPPRCTTCLSDREGYEEQWEADPWPCRTVRLLAGGYKHREGYAEHWG